MQEYKPSHFAAPLIRLWLIIALWLSAVLTACAPQATPVPTVTPSPSPTSAPTFTPLPPTATPTPTATTPPTVTATATPPPATSTPEVQILPNLQIAKTWQEMQANFDGYRVPWASLINGNLAESIRQKIVPELIKSGWLKVPTDAEKMYSLMVGWEVSGFRKIVTTSLIGSPVYRPKAIGWLRIMTSPEINPILERNGWQMPSDPSKQFFQVMVVVYWAKYSEANDKTMYEPRILSYANGPYTIEFQQSMYSTLAIYPFIQIPPGGMEEGLPFTLPLSDAEVWAKQGFPGKAYERILNIMGTPFSWP